MLALLVIVAVLAVPVSFVGGWMLRANRAKPLTEPAAPRPTHSVAAGPTPTEAALTAALIRSHDLGDGVRSQIYDDLAALDIHLIDALPGTVFDSTRHKAVGSVGAPAPGQVGTVAALVRPGWHGPNGAVIRFPEVSVYAPVSVAR